MFYKSIRREKNIFINKIMLYHFLKSLTFCFVKAKFGAYVGIFAPTTLVHHTKDDQFKGCYYIRQISKKMH